MPRQTETVHGSTVAIGRHGVMFQGRSKITYRRQAEQGEINALDELVAGCDDDFVKAGIQNLQLMIWPALEETFDKVRELIDGNPAAELVSTQALCCGCL